jgi:hypothetical protein
MQQIWEKTIVPVTSTKFSIAYELSMVEANAVMREFTGHPLLPIRRLSPNKSAPRGLSMCTRRIANVSTTCLNIATTEFM